MPRPKQESVAPEDQDAPGIIEDPKLTFGNCDLELFRTGAHTDVRIVVGNHRFSSHRAILSARSVWFKEKLAELGQQPQEPGVVPTIQVTTHKAPEVELVLVFIYAGEIDPKIVEGESFPVACTRLYDLGHDFAVAGLSDFATSELGTYLSSVLQMLCDQRLSSRMLTNGRTEMQDRLRCNDFMANYLAGVEAADGICQNGGRDDRMRPLQMLIDFFVAGKDILLREPEMELFLDGDVVPSFAKMVLLTEKKGGWRSKWMKGLVAKPPAHPTGKKGLCWECNGGLRNLKETGGVGVVNPKSREVTYTQVQCAHCAAKEKNVGNNGLVRWDVFDPKKD